MWPCSHFTAQSVICRVVNLWDIFLRFLGPIFYVNIDNLKKLCQVTVYRSYISKNKTFIEPFRTFLTYNLQNRSVNFCGLLIFVTIMSVLESIGSTIITSLIYIVVPFLLSPISAKSFAPLHLPSFLIVFTIPFHVAACSLHHF